MIWLKNYQNNIYTTSSLAATSLCFKGGCWSKFRGIFFLMNFELLTFPCRDMIKVFTIHAYMTGFQNESISIQKTHILV